MIRKNDGHVVHRNGHSEPHKSDAELIAEYPKWKIKRIPTGEVGTYDQLRAEKQRQRVEKIKRAKSLARVKKLGL